MARTVVANGTWPTHRAPPPLGSGAALLPGEIEFALVSYRTKRTDGGTPFPWVGLPAVLPDGQPTFVVRQTELENGIYEFRGVCKLKGTTKVIEVIAEIEVKDSTPEPVPDDSPAALLSFTLSLE